MIAMTKFSSSVRHFSLLFVKFSTVSLQESLRAAVEAKCYERVPDILRASKSRQCLNPFNFLSELPQNIRIVIIDEMLQAFMSVRPRSHPQIAYSCLLSYSLQTPNPLPVSLAILQHTLRTGCRPVSQTYLSLSHAWLQRRRQSESVSSILLEMQSIGYHPDCGTCNYLILSLCKIDQLKEAIKVLKGMTSAGCIPDLDSYGNLINKMCELRNTSDVVEMLREMVTKFGLNPRREMVVKAVAALRANKEMQRAVEMVQFLEDQHVHVCFEIYETVLEGCLACHQFVLAGKFVMRMTEQGFIPYIEVRQNLVEALANVGEWQLARVVRQRFAELKS